VVGAARLAGAFPALDPLTVLRLDDTDRLILIACALSQARDREQADAEMRAEMSGRVSRGR
jgi:hypothetical protein